MFVGETGIGRVVKRTLEVMAALARTIPPRSAAPARSTCRRCSVYLNFWFSSSLDLFGAENSSNAATLFRHRHQGTAGRDEL